MIKIKNLVKSYSSVNVLKGINLEVAEGEVYGFIGHNGAGKSTTMNILSGLIGFESGICIIKGRNILKNKSKIFKDIGYLPEDPKFYTYMNSWEYLSFMGTMGGETKSTIREKSEKLIDLVKLTKASKRAIRGYSRGMKQRLGIAVAMYHDPDILLLDEPSSALDPEGRRDVMDIILALKDRGKTIFLSTHILNDIERVCDRVGIINDGQIIIEEKLDTLLKSYIQPVYDLEFDTVPDGKEIDMLKGLEYVDRVEANDRKASLWVKDIKADGGRILRQLGDMDVALVSMNLRKSSLEEIFLKVVR